MECFFTDHCKLIKLIRSIVYFSFFFLAVNFAGLLQWTNKDQKMVLNMGPLTNNNEPFAFEEVSLLFCY